jgi:hypothetical protein
LTNLHIDLGTADLHSYRVAFARIHQKNLLPEPEMLIAARDWAKRSGAKPSAYYKLVLFMNPSHTSSKEGNAGSDQEMETNGRIDEKLMNPMQY